ncbi:MAG: DUF3667 domain-containing protein [Gemmatimonadaceae bacterium]
MSASCLNCDAPLSGPYCASCGQKQGPNAPTLREFLHETTAELTDLEGRVPRTLLTLLREPGRLTQDFLAGRRSRWLPPLRLYLICSIAYFLASALGEAITHRSERIFAQFTVRDQSGRVSLTPEGRQQVSQLLPARFFGVERLERALVNNASFTRTIESALPKAMFLLLPLFAAMTRVAWRRTGRTYPAHLYLALHLHAAWFAVITVTTILTTFVSSTAVLTAAGGLALAYIVWYSLVALRRAFGDPWHKTVIKVAVVGALYAASLNAASVAILSYAIVSA